MDGDQEIKENWVKWLAGDGKINPESISLLLWVLAIGMLLYFLRGVSAPLLLSIIISYLMNILVKQLETKYHFRHAGAVGLVFVLSWGVLLTTVLCLTPLLIDQVYNLITSIPNLVDYLEHSLMRASKHLPETFLKGESGNVLWNYLADYASSLGNKMLGFFVGSLSGAGNLLFYLLVIPTLSFFMLRDRDQILAWLGQFWPSERTQLEWLWHRVQIDLLGYLRGKLLEMAIVVGVSAIFFTVFGLPYALLFALLMGISVFIPYVGIATVSFPVLIVAVLQWGFGMRFGCFLAIYTLLNTLEGQLLAPLLMAKVLTLHPLAIILAVFCFGYWFGLWGVLFAIPLVSLLRLLLLGWPMASVQRVIDS